MAASRGDYTRYTRHMLPSVLPRLHARLILIYASPAATCRVAELLTPPCLFPRPFWRASTVVGGNKVGPISSTTTPVDLSQLLGLHHGGRQSLPMPTVRDPAAALIPRRAKPSGGSDKDASGPKEESSVDLAHQVRRLLPACCMLVPNLRAAKLD